LDKALHASSQFSVTTEMLMGNARIVTMTPLFASRLLLIAVSFLVSGASDVQLAAMPTPMARGASYGSEHAGQAPAPGRSIDLDGNWIVRGYPNGMAMGLIKLTGKGSTLEASLLPTAYHDRALLAKSSIDDLRVDATSLHFKIRFGYPQRRSGSLMVFDAYLPVDEPKPAILAGSMNLDGDRWRWAARLERTALNELDKKAMDQLGPGNDGLHKYNEAKDPNTKLAIIRESLEQYPQEPMACTMARVLVYELAGTRAAVDEVRRAAADAVKICTPYGPEMMHSTLHWVAWSLVNSLDFVDLGLEYARRAESALRPSDPPELRASVLKTLAAALRKAGNTAEAAGLNEPIGLLDAVLDQEFEKKRPAVKPNPFGGRRGGGDRAVLLELFTGAQCNPCVVADLAADGLLQTYRPDELVVIEHHLGIAGFDPLANHEGDQRGRFYGVAYTPSISVDGKDMGVMGLARGNRALLTNPQAGYDLARPWIESRLEVETEAELALSAERGGDRIRIKAEVSRLKRTGEKTRLRLVLLDDVVSYRGWNGIRLHRHVPRSFPGGVDGFALTEASCKKEVGIHLGIVRKDLERYLDRFGHERNFADNDRPVAFGRLKVVGFIQDDATKQVLQARQVDVQDVQEP
jgi:hypothetical protein